MKVSLILVSIFTVVLTVFMLGVDNWWSLSQWINDYLPYIVAIGYLIPITILIFNIRKDNG